MRPKSFLLLITLVFCVRLVAQPLPSHNLKFDRLADVWDEAIPIGNATLGALIWEKDGKLRFSLDRSDLWDQRPMKGLHRKEFSFDWVKDQVLQDNYGLVQEYFDKPYNREPAPSKIPGCGLEFSLTGNPKVVSSELVLGNALAEVKWNNGLVLKTFVHATKPFGWFRFENMSGEISPQLVPPPYHGKIKEGGEVNSLVGDDLARLGYTQGVVRQEANELTYEQDGWGGFMYKVSVRWEKTNDHTLEGVWSISSHYPDKTNTVPASAVTSAAKKAGWKKAESTHSTWWKDFWGKSSLRVPDPLLEKQWYLEQYKFGSTARHNAPPISLQAVWTADHGRIPPWKGDFHHDLNTQLSYWPAYSGNHLQEAIGYLNHLDENTNNYLRYTQQYFGKGGLNVPGVTTLNGTEMGGWIQYSLSPTVSAWLAQHYYLQWRYSMDRDFLQKRAYPWFQNVCIFLEQITQKVPGEPRRLPLSSSPEINDNRKSAWFFENTNYDLALMRFAFEKGAELARELGLKEDAARWQTLLAELPGFSLSKNQELNVAPGTSYSGSHRHFSHLMAIHPLGLLKWDDGEKARTIIRNSLAQLEAIGPDGWCGYSYAWLGNLQARAKNGEGAARALEIFAKAFCLPNSFHANGDQTKSGYSKMTYRPFTLEGNMAFAAGLQEMMLQSHAGYIDILPAIPAQWEDVSFHQLRAEGAVLVSVEKKKGHLTTVRIRAEKPGTFTVKLPFENWEIASEKRVKATKTPDGRLTLTAGKEGEIHFIERK